MLYAYSDQFRYGEVRCCSHVTHPTTARAKLRSWLGRITLGRRPKRLSDTDEDDIARTTDVPRSVTRRPHFNIAFTFSGLEALKDPQTTSVRVSRRVPARARAYAATDRGDVAASSPKKWLPGLDTFSWSSMPVRKESEINSSTI